MKMHDVEDVGVLNHLNFATSRLCQTLPLQLGARHLEAWTFRKPLLRYQKRFQSTFINTDALPSGKLSA